MRSDVRALWSRYLAAERDGYRPASLAALSDLLDAVGSVEDRDQLAETVFRAYERFDSSRRRTRLTLREPLIARVLRPYVLEHIGDPAALWWALQTCIVGDEYLEMYCEYDRVGGSPQAGAMTYAVAVTGEPRWWRQLLGFRLSVVDFATHHLDEGRGLVDGPVVKCVIQLCAAVAIVDQAPAGAISPGLRDELQELWSLLRDWLRYDEKGRPGDDFPSWCRNQGSDHWVARHVGTRHYYYQR